MWEPPQKCWPRTTVLPAPSVRPGSVLEWEIIGTTSHTSTSRVIDDLLAGRVLHHDGRQRLADGLHGLELELARVVHVEEPGDPLGGRVDVVANARVRIALDLLPEQRRAAVEVLLDGGDLEVGSTSTSVETSSPFSFRYSRVLRRLEMSFLVGFMARHLRQTFCLSRL